MGKIGVDRLEFLMNWNWTRTLMRLMYGSTDKSRQSMAIAG